MDEEASFANLLSQSAAPSRPSWNTSSGGGLPEADPWANPFSASPSDPFIVSAPAAPTPALDFGSGSGSGIDPPDSPGIAFQASLTGLASPREKISPYVRRIEDDALASSFDNGMGVGVDPPSIIAAREQQERERDAEAEFASTLAAASLYTTAPTPDHDPFHVQPQPQPQPEPAPATARKLPSDLIDEDLLAESDPSISLKKAFVKSTPAPTSKSDTVRAATVSPARGGKKVYVFTPGKKAGPSADPGGGKGIPKEDTTTKPSTGSVTQPEGNSAPKSTENDRAALAPKTVENSVTEGESSQAELAISEEQEKVASKEKRDPEATPGQDGQKIDQPKADSTPDVPAEPIAEDTNAPTHLSATTVPLPPSAEPTPTASRAPTPLPPTATEEPTFSPLPTPSSDRVAVSPLDQPRPLENDTATAVPKAPGLDWSNGTGTGSGSKSSSRFGGRGWGALDDDNDNDDDDGGLFGRGGRSTVVRRTSGTATATATAGKSDPWSGTDGWGETGMGTPISAGPSQSSISSNAPESEASEAETETETETGSGSLTTPRDQPPPTPAKPRAPVFQISVSDPTRMGDPVRGYTVYTIRIRSTSPHYRKSDMSVLRRFSDFLWLFEALAINNPGVIVPPVPDKQPFGRFQDQFIETRRLALQRCLMKIAAHPILQLDPDLRMFLESDSFATDLKNRKAEMVPEKNAPSSGGILSNWTGPRYVEQDEWFDSRKAFLDSLEAQLRGLSKSIESASKSRLEMALAMNEFSDSMALLSDSDLGSAMCSALARLVDLLRREKEISEDQAKLDVMHLLNMSDEYVRFIASVRGAFASRIRAWTTWQLAVKDIPRLKAAREKLRAQGKLGDRVQSSLAEINDAERKVRDMAVDFENISRLVKSEFGRFERERVEEFKSVLEKQLDLQIGKQKELIEAWEGYHAVVLKMAQRPA